MFTTWKNHGCFLPKKSVFPDGKGRLEFIILRTKIKTTAVAAYLCGPVFSHWFLLQGGPKRAVHQTDCQIKQNFHPRQSTCKNDLEIVLSSSWRKDYVELANVSPNEVIMNVSVNVFAPSNSQTIPLGLIWCHGGDEHSCLHINDIKTAICSCAEDMATICNTRWDSDMSDSFRMWFTLFWILFLSPVA